MIDDAEPVRVGPLTRLLQAAKRSFFAAMDARHLRRLERCQNPQGRRIAGVIRRLEASSPVRDRERIARVEEQRGRWLGSEDPLVDGTLGPGREWDAGITLAEACAASKGPRPATLLHLLVQSLEPSRVLELGTNVGISAAYLSDAMEEAGTEGRLYTLEASPYRLRLAMDLHRRLGLENVSYREGLFTDTLPPTLDEMGTVDLAFIDGHHRYRPTIDYFDMVCGRLAPSAVVVFDDIRLGREMRRAWDHVTRDRRVAVVVDLYALGICVMADPPRPRPRLVLPPISCAIQHRDLSVREAGPHLLGLLRRSSGQTEW